MPSPHRYAIRNLERILQGAPLAKPVEWLPGPGHLAISIIMNRRREQKIPACINYSKIH